MTATDTTDTLHPDHRSATGTPTIAIATTLIVFGLDDAEKPHASWFTPEEAPLAEKAAGLMGMRILRLSDEKRRELAGKLSQGRLFDSGKAFVPFVNRTLYGQLDAMGGEVPPYVEAPPKNKAQPRKSTKAAKPIYVQATSLAELAAGQIVLAPEDGEDGGWWQAVIDEAKDDDLFVLHWHAWPKEPTLVRKRSQLTLLPPIEAAIS